MFKKMFLIFLCLSCNFYQIFSKGILIRPIQKVVTAGRDFAKEYFVEDHSVKKEVADWKKFSFELPKELPQLNKEDTNTEIVDTNYSTQPSQTESDKATQVPTLPPIAAQSPMQSYEEDSNSYSTTKQIPVKKILIGACVGSAVPLALGFIIGSNVDEIIPYSAVGGTFGILLPLIID